MSSDEEQTQVEAAQESPTKRARVADNMAIRSRDMCAGKLDEYAESCPLDGTTPADKIVWKTEGCNILALNSEGKTPVLRVKGNSFSFAPGPVGENDPGKIDVKITPTAEDTEALNKLFGIDLATAILGNYKDLCKPSKGNKAPLTPNEAKEIHKLVNAGKDEEEIKQWIIDNIIAKQGFYHPWKQNADGVMQFCCKYKPLVPTERATNLAPLDQATADAFSDPFRGIAQECVGTHAYKPLTVIGTEGDPVSSYFALPNKSGRIGISAGVFDVYLKGIFSGKVCYTISAWKKVYILGCEEGDTAAARGPSSSALFD